MVIVVLTRLGPEVFHRRFHHYLPLLNFRYWFHFQLFQRRYYFHLRHCLLLLDGQPIFSAFVISLLDAISLADSKTKPKSRLN